MTVRCFAAALAVAAVAQTALAQPAGGRFNNPIPNVPGKSLTGAVVTYAPGAKSPPHYHAPSAFITAYVLEGAVRSQVDDEPVKVLHVGESFTEKPGAHHVVSENASETEPARFLVITVIDTKEAPGAAPAKN